MTDLYSLPDDLPIPVDDGACDHLEGTTLPDLSLQSSGGSKINLSLEKVFLLFIFIL